jgi:hypothetical protein
MGGLDVELYARQNDRVCDELHTRFGVVRYPTGRGLSQAGGRERYICAIIGTKLRTELFEVR